jgi:spermidine synthase
MLVGVEIPLLMRILKEKYSFKDLVSQVFTFDYVGALLASLLFPLVLVPYLGMVRSALLFGMLNVAVGILALTWLKADQAWGKWLRVSAALALISLILGFVFSDELVGIAEAAAYPDAVVHARSTPYQRIVLTRAKGDLRLYLNGNLQFSSRDEYRYHEALVHPGLSALPQARSVLVLGGGDGLAVREILKYPAIERVQLVDLDPEMTRLFTQREELAELNHHAFTAPRVSVENADAFVWVEAYVKSGRPKFDFIVIDFPDPSNFSVGKLYTTRFYRSVRGLLAPGGAVVVQSTSPYVARKTFWCVDQTLREAGFRTWPYHAYVPAFGDWGYFLAAPESGTETEVMPDHSRLPSGLRYLDAGKMKAMFSFPADMGRVKMPAQRLNNQILVRMFEEEWAGYGH